MTAHNSTRTADHPVADVFLDRWSPRAFTGERISDDLLATFFEAMRWTPSSNNSQPWRIIYGHRGTAAFDKLLGVVSERNQRWARNGSVLLALLSKRTLQGAPARNHSFDAGAAWAHLSLQATHAGWATHAIGGFNESAAREAFGVSDDYNIDVCVVIGRRADPADLPDDLKARELPSQRNKVASFVSEGSFSREW